MIKKILVLAVVTIIILGLTAPATFAGRQRQQQESLSSTITLPSGKVIKAPTLKYLPSEDGWLTDINEGLKLAQQETQLLPAKAGRFGSAAESGLKFP